MNNKNNEKSVIEEKTKNNSKTPMEYSLSKNISAIKELFGKSYDLLIRRIIIDSVPCAIFSIDGMCNEQRISDCILQPVTDTTLRLPSDMNLFEKIEKLLYTGTDIKRLQFIEETAQSIIAGNLILVGEGFNFVLSFGAQGFSKKSISEPQSEQNERGSIEAFTDNFKDNSTLLRRRLKTPDLVIENMSLGQTSNTSVLICYLGDRVSSELLSQVKQRLNKVTLDTVLGSGYLRPFLDSSKKSLFTDTGVTERPDVLSAMLSEGRIGIIVDGTPFAIIVPYLFSDYFHTPDDYLSRPYYAFFMRLLRFVSFFLATTLPGFFVAICIFHPEIIPADILLDIALSEGKTPFPLMLEALIIHLIYEIVREAGLRMPKSIGHAVSIVGALVIGDAAVTAGLIAAPMLIVVALTAITSSVISRLHEPVAILRFSFIIVGGLSGIYGVTLGVGLMLLDMCAPRPYKIPLSAPFSPFVLSAQRDTVIRMGWRKMGKKKNLIQGMKF